jgi:hypothetical protein
MKRLRNDLKSPRYWKDLWSGVISAAGFAGLLVGLVAASMPELLLGQTVWLIALVPLCLMFGIWRARPREIVQKYESGFEIRIVVGDLFEQGSNVVVGMSDTFAVATPEIIHPGSVQGQMLERVWGGDAVALREELLEALKTEEPISGHSHARNQVRFPIGTVATLRRNGFKYFCVAYSHMDNQNRAIATMPGITEALYSVWDAVDVAGNGQRVCCPLIGQGLSRLNVLTKDASLRLLALTFALRSNQARIASGLEIVLRQQDAERLDLREFQAFLQSLPGAIKS